MRAPFLVGERVYLRALDLADIDGPYLGWMNDAETTRFLDSGRFPTTRAALEKSVLAAGRSTGNLFLAIVTCHSDCHVGNVKLGPIDWVHRVGSIGILLGDAASRGKGYSSEAVGLVVRHAFEQLGLNKVTAGAYADHAASIKLFAAHGFVVEGRQRCHLYREGQYYDKVLMGLLRDEYAARSRRS
jgi:[ribosomal protein S5]-alanine N-acetyltransferase